MMKDKHFGVVHRSNYDNFKIKKISFDRECPSVDVHINHFYLCLHPDSARQLAKRILKVLEQTKAPLTKKEE